MFKTNFIKLCSQKGESPSFVCSQIGISAAAFSQWTDDTIPRKVTQQRIADYFGITVGELMSEPIKEKAPPPIVDDEAERLNRVLLYIEDLQKQGSRTDLEKVSETERALLSLFRQFPEDSQRLYLEALRAALKKQP